MRTGFRLTQLALARAAVVGCALAAAPAAGQQPEVAGGADRRAACERRLANQSVKPTRPLSFTDSITIFGTLRPATSRVRAPRSYLETVLAEIGRRFTAHPAATAAYGEVGFTIGNDGGVSDVRVLTTTMQRELAESAMRAIEAAGAVRAWGALPGGLGGDSLPLRLGIDPTADSATASQPLARLPIPSVRDYIRFEFEVEKPVMPRPGNNAPAYPEVARNAGVEDEVLMQFIVDEDGWAIPETFRVLRATYREFIEAVLKALPGYRFHPAEVDGCPVKQLVQMPFNFKLNR